MRVARGSGRVISDRLYSAARQSAEAITATGSVAIGLPRYLVLLGDALQSLPPSPPARPVNGASQPPACVAPVQQPENLKKGKGVENVSTSVPRLTPSRMSLGFAPAHPVGGVPLQAQGRLR
jgi:hypothetical protein